MGHVFAIVKRAGEASGRPYEGKIEGADNFNFQI
jgi:hypothetical protein